MLDLIRRLEGKDDLTRRNLLIEELQARNWDFRLQEYSFANQQGCNIIIDVNNSYLKDVEIQVQGPKSKVGAILLVAHYDSFFLSPGANDDASALAILIDAGEKLRSESLGHPLRIVFFDDEEPTVHWHKPIGSTMYVREYGVEDILAVVDLELCGMGDAVGIWPVEGAEQSPLLQEITAVLKEMKLPFDYGRRIPGFYADYLPFREHGLPDAFCLTAFHWAEKNKLQHFAEGAAGAMLLRYFAWRFFRLPTVPKVFQHYHSKADRSEFLSETTLQMMSDAVCGIVRRLGNRRAKGGG